MTEWREAGLDKPPVIREREETAGRISKGETRAEEVADVSMRPELKTDELPEQDRETNGRLSV